MGPQPLRIKKEITPNSNDFLNMHVFLLLELKVILRGEIHEPNDLLYFILMAMMLDVNRWLQW